MKPCLCAAALCAAVPTVLWAIDLEPQRDSAIYESCNVACGPSGGANGVGFALFAGRTGSFGVRRSLLRFDIAGHLPAGSTVTAVHLELYAEFGNTSGAQMVSLHRMTADWGEGPAFPNAPEGGGAVPAAGDATWLHRVYPADPWTGPGGTGDFVVTASASRLVGDALQYYDWSSPQMVADVQAWLDDPATNFGWMLRGNESSPGSAKRFISRHSFLAEQRPRLVVEFEGGMPVPAVGAAGTIALGGVLLTAGVGVMLRRRAGS